MTANKIMKLVPADLTPSTTHPFQDALESLGFTITSTSPGNKIDDIPLVVRFQRLRTEHIVTIYEHSFHLWVALLRPEFGVVEKLHERVPLMTSDEAFERAKGSIDTLEADLEVGVLALLAPKQPEPKWLDLYLRFFDHEDPLVRACACASVRWVRDLKDPGWPQLWDVVRRLHDEDPDEEVRLDARKVLHWQEGPKAEVLP